MDIERVYPPAEARRDRRLGAMRALGWPMALASYFCLAIDLFTTRQGWSLVVAWSIWLVWSTLVSPPLVERNRISFFVKLLTKCCVLLLLLIDVLLAPGWAGVVVPLVCFGGLVGSALLFFTDARRQRQNMLPLLLLIAASFLCAFFGLVSGRIAPAWPLGLMGAAALAELAGCAALLGPEFLREIKKRFDPNA